MSSFLLLFSRKSSLRHKCISLNAQSARLGSQLNILEDQIANLQKMKSFSQEKFNMMLNARQTMNSSIFQTGYDTSMAEFNKYQASYNEAKTNGDAAGMQEFEALMRKAQEQTQQQQQYMFNQQMQQATQLAALQQAFNSQQQRNEEVELTSLQFKQHQLTQEQDRIDTQAKTAQAELDNVEKSLDQAIKDAAPKYVA